MLRVSGKEIAICPWMPHSPGPPRLEKALAVRHPLPARGGGPTPQGAGFGHPKGCPYIPGRGL